MPGRIGNRATKGRRDESDDKDTDKESAEYLNGYFWLCVVWGGLLTGEFLIRNLLTKHSITIVLIIVYGIKLNARKKAKDVELRFFWIILICCFLLVLEDIAESVAALAPALRLFRIFFSVVGYALRPAAVVGMLLVICSQKRRTWKIWILCLINLAVYSTAFWSPVAFSYDRNYAFVRGPLGYSASEIRH